jgi:predicted nucleic acid-binding Zn ribbon protein
VKFPKALSSVLERTLATYGLKENAERYEALTHWAEIVGDQVASVAVPERIKGTSLIVRVESSVWKYELTMRSREILQKVHNFTGSNEITEIIWR